MDTHNIHDLINHPATQVRRQSLLEIHDWPKVTPRHCGLELRILGYFTQLATLLFDGAMAPALGYTWRAGPSLPSAGQPKGSSAGSGNWWSELSMLSLPLALAQAPSAWLTAVLPPALPYHPASPSLPCPGA